MMKRAMMTVLAVAVVVALVAVVPASAAPIDLTSVAGTNVTASTSDVAPSNTSNWSGMTGMFPDGTHNTSGSDVWLSGNEADGSQWIAWDLGQVYTVESMHVWNYNVTWSGSSFTTRGIKSFTLQTSADGSTWTDAGNIDWSDKEAPGNSSYAGFDFTLDSSVTTQHIRFGSLYNLGYGNASAAYVGLSEIVFYGDPIPEPATVSLLVLGAVGVVARRRRRK